ncbi:MAG: hypothetical protein ABF479_02790, partial [Gluconacetobacter sp.]
MQEIHALGGRMNTVPSARKQRISDAGFDGLNIPGDGGLTKPKHQSGFAEASLIEGRQGTAEMADIDRHYRKVAVARWQRSACDHCITVIFS